MDVVRSLGLGFKSDVAISAFLLGAEITMDLYGCSQAFIESQLQGIETSPFLQRLRQVLKQACATYGPEETCQSLQLPSNIVAYLAGDGKPASEKPQVSTDDNELAGCLSLEVTYDGTESTAPEEHKEIDVTLSLSDEEKRRAVNLYNKGIKLQYVAGLFGIDNPKVIHSWGDWKKRPKLEADKNLEKRRQIQKMLNRGDSVKAIRAELKLKLRVYRELMGVAVGPTFTRAMYDSVVQQMDILNSLKVVSKNTCVPIYFIKKWLSGKGIPEKDLFEADEEASVETKRRAVEKFYETGNALIAASATGARTPQLVERWVVRFQHAVDEREQTEARASAGA